MSLYLDFFKQLIPDCRNINLILQQYMERQKKQIQANRKNIRQKLKGSLSAWKLSSEHHKKRKITIEDRTPEPGNIENHFQDSYQKLKKIGEGASGCVYQCISRKDGKTFAVKVSRGDVQLLRISKRCFKIMKSLNHPNIIKAKCLYLNEVNQKLHFVMEYCNYPSLDQVSHLLSYAQKKQIIKQLIKTLNYLHVQGVCHRDIKLENVLYSQQQKEIKLIDFGISKRIFDKNKEPISMWTSTGTLNYMAPEMLDGSSYNQKVDIWALGVLTYKLFYGSFPFDSQYKSEMIQQITNSEPKYYDEDVIMNDFIKHLLHKNPEMRLSAAECLKHPWVQNDVSEAKERLGSGDDFDIILECRMRNYSVGGHMSPQVPVSRQDRINQLKQLNIFEQKRVYQPIKLNSY